MSTFSLNEFLKQGELKKHMKTPSSSSGSFALVSCLSKKLISHVWKNNKGSQMCKLIFPNRQNLKKHKGCQHEERLYVQQTQTQLTPPLRRTCPLTRQKNIFFSKSVALCKADLIVKVQQGDNFFVLWTQTNQISNSLLITGKSKSVLSGGEIGSRHRCLQISATGARPHKIRFHI